jgi:hypothetical protein
MTTNAAPSFQRDREPLARDESQTGEVSQPQTEPTQPATDATRYLCAGLYGDDAYLRRVRATLIEDQHHSIAVSPAVDLKAVLRHCIAAGKRQTKRQLAHCAILLATLAVEVMWLGSRSDAGFGVLDPPLLLGGLAAILISLRYQWSPSFGKIAAQLRRETFDPDPLRGAYGFEANDRIEELSDISTGNVVVYSGFSPFVGSGIDLGGWSFTVDAQRGKEQFDGTRTEAEPFELAELYSYVESKLVDLGIRDLVVTDSVFINGRDIRDDERFLPDPYRRPLSRISETELQSYVDEPDLRVRHYKCARIVDWRGELVLSVFFRVAKRGASLFAETCFFLLTPIKEAYRSVDNQPLSPSVRQAIGIFIASLVLAPFQALWSPLALFGKAQGAFERRNHENEQERQIREQPLYDFGASTSVRELGSSGVYRRYFQKLDKEMYAKLAQRTLLDALCEFLEEHNVDVSDVRERQSTIFNSGVMVSGGTINTDTLTVGKRARSIRNAIQGAAAPAVPSRAAG